MTRRKFMEARKKRLQYKIDIINSVFCPYNVCTKKEGVQHPPVSTPRYFNHLSPSEEHRCIT